MAIALSDIRNIVRLNIDEPTASHWSNANLNILINQRYQQLYTAVVDAYGGDYNLKTATINAVANQQEYGTADGMPADIFKLRRVEINYDTSNVNSVNQSAFPLYNIDAIRDRISNTAIGLLTYTHPNYYFFGPTVKTLKIGFIPIPDKSTGQFTIWYNQTIPNLVADTDTIDYIPYQDRYWHLISTGAAGDALRFGAADSPEADKFDAKWDNGIATMQQQLVNSISEDSKAVLDVTGDYLDFGHGF